MCVISWQPSRVAINIATSTTHHQRTIKRQQSEWRCRPLRKRRHLFIRHLGDVHFARTIEQAQWKLKDATVALMTGGRYGTVQMRKSHSNLSCLFLLRFKMINDNSLRWGDDDDTLTEIAKTTATTTIYFPLRFSFPSLSSSMRCNVKRRDATRVIIIYYKKTKL